MVRMCTPMPARRRPGICEDVDSVTSRAVTRTTLGSSSARSSSSRANWMTIMRYLLKINTAGPEADGGIKSLRRAGALRATALCVIILSNV
jgi:hypothetical protein